MLNVIKDFARANQNGLFINSCFSHCQTERQDTWFADNSPVIRNKVSLALWTNALSLKNIDSPVETNNVGGYRWFFDMLLHNSDCWLLLLIWYNIVVILMNVQAIALAVGDWYFDRAGVKVIDCPYPCDNTCHHLIFRWTKVYHPSSHSFFRFFSKVEDYAIWLNYGKQ